MRKVEGSSPPVSTTETVSIEAVSSIFSAEKGMFDVDAVFSPIDFAHWPRASHFEYYTNIIRTNYAVTVRLDVSALRQQCQALGLRFYPAMLYAIMRAVNSRQEFRMAYRDGVLGFYSVCHPSYTIFHADDHTFSDIWSEYHPHFPTFYAGVLRDIDIWRDVKGVKTKPDRPNNFCPVSCVPWLDFTAAAHDTAGPGPMFFPVITFGKYTASDGKLTLPLCLHIHHAAADGYHTSMLLSDIQSLLDHCTDWLAESAAL